MHSLRVRLLVLWGLSLAACIAVGFLLLQLYHQSTEAQVGRAEAVVRPRLRPIRDRYDFYAAGWSGPAAGSDRRPAPRDLTVAVRLALAHQRGVEGGIWQADAGPLAYAFPTYEGTGPKTDLPSAEREQIQAVNQQAPGRTTGRPPGKLGVADPAAACLPARGPDQCLTAWTMTRVRAARGFRPLQLGLGVLLG